MTTWIGEQREVFGVVRREAGGDLISLTERTV